MTDKGPPSEPVGRGLFEELEENVGHAGRVEDVYGGLRITVLDAESFAWRKVLEILVARQRRVWIRQGKPGLEILTQS